MKVCVFSDGAHFTLRGNVNSQITHTGFLKSPKHKVPLLGREVRFWYTVSVCQIMRPVCSEEEKSFNCYVHLIVVPFDRELRGKVKMYLLHAGHCLGQHSKFLS
jgi:hypothetical protein